MAVIARRENLTHAPIINVITDFEAEPIWVKPEISLFAVPTESVGEQLQGWRANPDRIKVCGIPLDASFSVQHDERKTRQKFGLDKRPLILLMGGGMGPTRMDAVARQLLQRGDNLQIVALPGRDRRARRNLKKLKNTESATLLVLDWTMEVAALMQTAQILVTKPGGVTLAEAAACALPLVLFDAIPGPEEVNAQRFCEAGAAIRTKGTNETARSALKLFGDKQILGEMAAQIKKLAEPEAARKIVRLAIWQKSEPFAISSELVIVPERIEQTV